MKIVENRRFRNGIKRGCGFVQYEKRRFLIDSPRYGKLLTLSPGYFYSGIRKIVIDTLFKGKIQLGSAWWFCDHRDGMEEQIKVLANLGCLPAFVGMLTDSRSFLSYSRHEYFRRILCNVIGGWADNGEVPNDEEMLGKIVSDISFNNAQKYFEG